MNIRLQNLKHVYQSPTSDPRLVLDIPAWSVEEGQQVLVRGVSGSGKTTLFNIMTGLLHPAEGQVHYDDIALFELPEAARDRFRAQHVGYIFQNHFLLGTLTAVENVEMPMAFARDPGPRERRERAVTILSQLGLADHLNYYPRQLSTGQRMRVAVARALANQPTVIFADEPTAALDEAASHQVMDLLQQTCQQNNAILLVASHDPALEERFAHFVDLQNGHLTAKEKQPA